MKNVLWWYEMYCNPPMSSSAEDRNSVHPHKNRPNMLTATKVWYTSLQPLFMLFLQVKQNVDLFFNMCTKGKLKQKKNKNNTPTEHAL